MRSLLGRFHRPMSRGLVNNMLTMNNLGDGSTLSLDFTTGALDSRLTFTRSTTATYINSSGYVTSAAINAPRFDYSPTTIGQARGLLIEGQGINYLTYSNSFTVSAAWGVPTNLNTTAWTGFTAPDQSTNAVRLVPNTTSGAHRIEHSDVAGLSNSTQYTVSMWCKPDGYPRLGITASNSNARRNFAPASNASTGYGTSSTGTITAFAGGWYRVTMTFTTGAANTPFGVWLSVHNVDEDPITSWAGNNTDGMQVWGVQVEAGSGASSYIPTGASQVTRNGDICYIPISSIGFSTSGGTFFTSFYRGEVDGGFPAQASSVINTDYADTRWLGIGSGYGSTTFGFGAWNGSINKTGAGVFGLNKAAGSYASWVTSTTGIFTVNGATAVTGTLSNLGTTPNYLMIGSASQSSPYNGVGLRDYHNNSIRSIKYFPTAFTAAQLQTLTAP